MDVNANELFTYSQPYFGNHSSDFEKWAVKLATICKSNQVNQFCLLFVVCDDFFFLAMSSFLAN